MDKDTWKSFTSENIRKNSHLKIILRKTLNQDQIVEFDMVRNLSEKLIIDNYDRNPAFDCIKKTLNGYVIHRRCRLKNKHLCGWNININTNEAILSCSRECEHTNPIKRKN